MVFILPYLLPIVNSSIISLYYITMYFRFNIELLSEVSMTDVDNTEISSTYIGISRSSSTLHAALIREIGANFSSKASPSAVCDSTDTQCIPIEYTEESSGSTCSINTENAEQVDNPTMNEEPKSKRASKRKYSTPAQDALLQKINALKDRMSCALLAGDVQLSLHIENDLKKTREEMLKQEQILKNKKNNAMYQAKYRRKLKEQLKKASTSSFDVGLRSKPGRPRLEEKQEGLLDAIKAAAVDGSAAQELQGDEIECSKTLTELQSKVQEAGFTISRSTLYTRLIPKNSKTVEGARHVVTVPVRLAKPANEHKQLLDEE